MKLLKKMILWINISNNPLLILPYKLTNQLVRATIWSFASRIDCGKHGVCSLWSLYKRRIHLTLMAVMLCFTLLKSGNCEVTPPHTNHIVRDWKKACDEVCHARTIQHCFMGTLRRNTEGDIDESLVPQSIRDWYNGTDDEQDTESENESDCELN